MLLFVVLLVLGVLPALIPAGAAGGVVYVNHAASGAADGSSWADAFPLLQDALAAAVPGDEVWVAAGLYKPGTLGDSRTNTFWIDKSIALYGGFAGGESSRAERDWEANVTVLSGDLAGNDITNAYGVVLDWSGVVGNDNCYDVMTTWGAFCTIDGFTITGGRGDWDDPRPLPHGAGNGLNAAWGNLSLSNLVFRGNHGNTKPGGAIYFWESTGTVSHVSFIGNDGSDGGGVYCRDASIVFTDVLFQENDAIDDDTTVSGGGMYVYGTNTQVFDCQFISNSSVRSGGGLEAYHNIVVSNVLFQGNGAQTGGGMWDPGGSRLTDCRFIDNTAGRGGGLGSKQIYATGAYTRLLFQGNYATNSGGGLYIETAAPVVRDSTFTGNRSGYAGGAVWCSARTPQLINVIIRSNSATYGSAVQVQSGGINLTGASIHGNTGTYLLYNMVEAWQGMSIRNSIIWGNGGSVFGTTYINSNVATARYSIIQSGYPAAWVCDHVSTNDPLFIDAAGGNLRLAANSPAIDAGDNTVTNPALPLTDFDGNPRKSDILTVPDTGLGTPPIVDMGAYEMQMGDGIYIGGNGGLWSATNSWQQGLIADGTNATAYFSEDEYMLVYLDANRTLGHIVAGGGTNTYCRIDPDGSYRLTFATDSGTPSIRASNTTVMLRCRVGGLQGLDKWGDGVLNITSPSCIYSGVLNVCEGLFEAGRSNAFGLGGVGNETVVHDGASVWVAPSTHIGESIALTGAGLSPHHAALVLSESNTVSGPITLNGDARIGALGSVGPGTSTLGGTLVLPAAAVLTVTTRVVDLTINGAVSGSGAIRKTGPETLHLAGSNTYSGGTAVEQGVLLVSSDTNLGDTAGALTLEGGLVRVSGTNFGTMARGLVGAASGSGMEIEEPGNTVILTGALSGHDLTKSGPGTLALRGAAGAFTGTLVVAEGTLAAGIGNSLGENMRVSLSGGAILRVEDNEAVGSLVGEAGSRLLLEGHNFQLGPDGTDGTFAGTVEGDGWLRKTGAGTVLFSGSLCVTGQVTVEAGAMRVTGGNEPMTGTIQVYSNATLYAGAGNSLGESTRVILDAGSAYVGEGGELFGSLTGAGRITLSNGYGMTIGVDGSDMELVGTLEGDGPVTKQGVGTLRFSGDGTNYLGAVTCAGGLFAVDGGALVTSTLVVGVNGGCNMSISNGTVQAKGLARTGHFSSRSGTLEIDAGGSLTCDMGLIVGHDGDGVVIQTAGSRVAVTGGQSLHIAEDAGSDGVYLLHGGSLDVSGDLCIGGNGSAHSSTGLLSVADAASLTVGGTLNVWTGARLVASGTLAADLLNAGSVEPEGSFVTLTIDGNYTQNAGGQLLLDLGGTARGVTHDALDVTGTAAPGGTLVVRLADGYTPALGDRFDLLDWGAIAPGTAFEHIELPALPTGCEWCTNQLYADGSLLVGLPAAWLGQFELSPTNNPWDDPDRDTYSTEAEYVADTDPTDSNDYFRVVAIDSSPTAIRFQSSSNRLYTLSGTSNLLDGAWLDIQGAGPRLGSGGLDTLTDTNGPPLRPFYRIDVQLP